MSCYFKFVGYVYSTFDDVDFVDILIVSVFLFNYCIEFVAKTAAR